MTIPERVEVSTFYHTGAILTRWRCLDYRLRLNQCFELRTQFGQDENIGVQPAFSELNTY